MLYEVRVCHESEEATVYISDEAVAQLPTSVLSRSAVLQQAIWDVDQDEVISLNLPKGVLGAWFAGLDLLDVDWRLPRLPQGNEHHHRPEGHLKLFDCLKVRCTSLNLNVYTGVLGLAHIYLHAMLPPASYAEQSTPWLVVRSQIRLRCFCSKLLNEFRQVARG